MASKHVIKLSDTEAVVKCYITDPAGGTVDISLVNDLTSPTQILNGQTIDVGIQELFWGAKKDKQIDITRIVDANANTVHNHYFLTNSGSYDFVGFVDNIYSDKNIRITGDGAFHVILKLRKTKGWTKL